MNYLSLVNMLSIQITPEARKIVLNRLTEMNNELLGIQMQTMMANKVATVPERSKDAIEMVHPSFIHQRSVHNPNKGSSIDRRNNIQTSPNSPEIDLDDILEDPDNHRPQPDDLDIKLARIKKLHTKILSDKRKRREANVNCNHKPSHK